MIKIYPNGTALVEENKWFLDTNPYLSMYFTLDAGLLHTTDKVNYALKAQHGEQMLLAMQVEPFALLVFGCESLVPELLSFLLSNGYRVARLLSSETVGDRMAREFWEVYGIRYTEALAMDFMEATEVTQPSCGQVEIPTEADLDQLVECKTCFVADCGLDNPVDRENTRQRLGEYRVLRRDGRIVSMASIGPATPEALKIACVYTRPEYRGRGLARLVVNTAKNEILAQGKIATLNVDKKNPITNHLYRALGFRPVFSQGEYRPAPDSAGGDGQKNS